MAVEDGNTNNAGGTGAGSIPKGLEKFATADGQLDVSKLSQGYLEAEKMAHEASQKASTIEKSYASLAESISGTGAEGDEAGDEGAGSTDDVRDQGAGRSAPVRKAAPPAAFTRQEAQPLVESFIAIAHPEVAIDPSTNDFKDKKFIAGLKGYVAGLPLPVKQSIAMGDFAATNWAITQFKALQGAGKAARSGVGAGGGQGPNFLEGATAGATGEGKIWTRAEIQELYRKNPDEYSKKVREISQAYEEGRVKE